MPSINMMRNKANSFPTCLINFWPLTSRSKGVNELRSTRILCTSGRSKTSLPTAMESFSLINRDIWVVLRMVFLKGLGQSISKTMISVREYSKKANTIYVPNT